MSSSTANTTAKIAAASSGPRQLSTLPSPERLLDVAEQLPLILAIRGHRRRRQRMRAIPNEIEHSQAATQFLRDFRPGLDRCLRTPPPTAREFIEIFAICAIAANRQPFALRQSREQAQIRGSQREAQFAFAFQPVRQCEPFV